MCMINYHYKYTKGTIVGLLLGHTFSLSTQNFGPNTQRTYLFICCTPEHEQGLTLASH